MEPPPHPALHRPIHRIGLRTTLIAAGVLVAVVPLAELIVLITTGWAPLHTLDLNIVHSVNRYAAHHSGQVQFWKIVSIISGPTVLRIAAFLAVVLLWVRRRRAAAILVAVAIGGAAALSGIFKVLVNRGRPVVAVPVEHADYPGTFAMRRSAFLRMGGYDGDVLFENLQMIRTFHPAGAVEVIAKDLFIIRRPPTAARFFDQRIRQAYDDFAQPARLVVEAAWLPAIAVARRRPWTLCGGMLAAVLVAETGRRRNNGTTAFPPNSGWAPVWVLERAVCVWIALLLRLAGGVRYRGTRISSASKPRTARPPLPLLNVPAYEGTTDG